MSECCDLSVSTCSPRLNCRAVSANLPIDNQQSRRNGWRVQKTLFDLVLKSRLKLLVFAFCLECTKNN